MSASSNKHFQLDAGVMGWQQKPTERQRGNSTQSKEILEITQQFLLQNCSSSEVGTFQEEIYQNPSERNFNLFFMGRRIVNFQNHVNDFLII